MKTVVRNEHTRRKKKEHKIIALAMLVLFAMLAYSSYSLYGELQSLKQQRSELEEMQQEEEERADLLNDQYAYMQTISYLEEMARKKLGLVYPDDIILQEKKEK